MFAGPNGSGKSTVIEYVRSVKVSGRSIDFGHYINADDIAGKLRGGGLDFSEFSLTIKPKDFIATALTSGLINDEFTRKDFISSFSLRSNVIRLKNRSTDERMAQVLADFLRKKMLELKRKFSFETVFSHSSKLEVMRRLMKRDIKFTCILFLLNHRRSTSSESRQEKQKMDMMCRKKKL